MQVTGLMVQVPRRAAFGSRCFSRAFEHFDVVIRSVIVTLCILAIAITAGLLLPWLLCAFAMSFILAAVSRIAGKVAYSRTSYGGLHSQM